MITSVNASNIAKYQVLFDKATAFLKTEQPSDISDKFSSTDSWNNFSIDSLNEYFAYLETLVKTAKSDEEKAFYVRLPLDEDVFAINANTREILVPNNFSRYGVGVVGDEMAEILYFTIDRYFDSIDLAATDVNIVIQWEIKQNNTTAISGMSKNFGKDVESIPGKIIFGWPIIHQMTANANTIKFAIRFYKLNSENNALTYNLATLPAQVKINDTLNFEIDPALEIDSSAQILNRITSSGIYDSRVDRPASPVFIENTMYVVNNGIPSQPADYTVDLNNNSLQLAAAAKSTDIGALQYVWSYEEQTGTQEYEYDITDAFATEASLLYVKETNQIDHVNTPWIYYIKTGDVYNLVDDWTNYSYDTNTKKHSFGSSEVELYKVYSTRTAQKAGKYKVQAATANLINTSTPCVMPDDKCIIIPGPNESYNPSIPAHAFVEIIDNTPSISIEASGVETINNDEVEYQWKKNDNEDIANQTTNTLSLTLESNNLNLDEEYSLTFTAKRNNAKYSITSNTCRVTQLPEAPQISINNNIQTPFTRINTTIVDNAEAALSADIGIEHLSDKSGFLWKKLNKGNDTSSTNAIIAALQQNLEDKIDEIQDASNINIDTVLSDGFTDINKFGTDASPKQYSQNNSKISNIGLQVASNDTNIYYCIVANELNGKVNVNISPIWVISKLL